MTSYKVGFATEKWSGVSDCAKKHQVKLANHPRVLFHAGRDYYSGHGWVISVSWGLIPVEDQKEGEHIYRHSQEIMFRFGINFWRR